MSSRLVVPARSSPAADRSVVSLSPAAAGWRSLGLEVLDLRDGETAAREAAAREVCIVVASGTCDVRCAAGEWTGLGGRANAFDGQPEAVYLPPHLSFEVRGRAGGAEVAICSAPAAGGAEPRVIRGGTIVEQTRGRETHERLVRRVLMAEEPADALLVCEVVTPGGHWTAYPPHKHDTDDLPAEALLEELYYVRVDPPQGFAVVRVYTADGSLDETFAVHDRDVVMLPRGFHTVAAAPGYTLCHLIVMAGPVRTWAITVDPHHRWVIPADVPPAAS